MNWKQLAILFCLITSLSIWGCTSVTPIIGPDGTENYFISSHSIERCYLKAGEICQGPYQVLNTSSDVSSNYSGDVDTEIKILVKCGK